MKKRLFFFVLTFAVFLFIFAFVPVAANNANTNALSQNGYEQAKADWQAKMKELKTKRGEITAEIKALNLEKAKTMVGKAIDKAIARLEKIKEKIAASNIMQSPDKDKYETQIDGYISELQTIKNEVAATQSKQELKTASQKARAKMKEIRTKIKDMLHEIQQNNIKNVIQRLNNAAQGLGIEITQLQTKGVNTNDLEKLLNEAKNYLSDATNKQNSGDWQEARKVTEQARAKLAKLAGQIKAEKAKLQGDENENK